MPCRRVWWKNSFAVSLISASLLMLGFPTYQHANADDFQVLCPDDSIPGTPFIEFRARGPAPGPSHLVGHVFIALGRTLSNGASTYEGVGGFYPDKTSKVEKVLILVPPGVPGTIRYHLDDLKSDKTFRVLITPSQEKTVLFVMKNWNSNRYNLLTENCISLARAVARAVNLNVPDMSSYALHSPADWPVEFVNSLRDHNSTDVRQAEGDRQRAVIGTSLNSIRSLPMIQPFTPIRNIQSQVRGNIDAQPGVGQSASSNIQGTIEMHVGGQQ